MKLFLPDQYRRGNRRMIVLFLVISTNKKAICVLPWSSSWIGRWRRMAEGHVGQPVTTSCQQYLFKNCEAAQASLTARERDEPGELGQPRKRKRNQRNEKRETSPYLSWEDDHTMAEIAFLLGRLWTLTVENCIFLCKSNVVTLPRHITLSSFGSKTCSLHPLHLSTMFYPVGSSLKPKSKHLIHTTAVGHPPRTIRLSTSTGIKM
jgi:hypothetical protein